MKKNRITAGIWIGSIMLALAVSGGCGAKYEPISLDREPQSVGTEGITQSGQGEKKNTDPTEGESKSQKLDDSATSGSEMIDSDSMENRESEETESSEQETEPESDVATEAGTGDDTFYQQCGMSRESAENIRMEFIEDVMNDSKEAVAARIIYPRMVTVASGTYEVQDAVSFLAYYDEIFTESFKMEIDWQAEQELFCKDGMISFGTGIIWFSPSDGGNDLKINTINGMDGCSVRYGGQ